MLSAAEIASMTATVAGSLDITLPRVRTAKTLDGYGHNTPASTTTINVAMNIMKPSATQLQAFAGAIGSQGILLIRVMPTSDVQPGDEIVYQGKHWLVHNIQSAESYSFANEFLIATVS